MLSPPRTRGSTSVDKKVDSRFRGNDPHRVIFESEAQGSPQPKGRLITEVAEKSRSMFLCALCGGSFLGGPRRS